LITALYDPGTKEKGRFITDLAEIKAIVEHGRGTLWIHLAQVSDDDQQHVLHGIFNFHPLAIEDTLSHGYQPPKAATSRPRSMTLSAISF
jgi:Mg2+ and Co2+ transporter CorA